jgi:hypothetical protein
MPKYCTIRDSKPEAKYGVSLLIVHMALKESGHNLAESNGMHEQRFSLIGGGNGTYQSKRGFGVIGSCITAANRSVCLTRVSAAGADRQRQ